MTANDRMLVFVGSYAEAASDGIYVYELNEGKGELTLLDKVDGNKNPTFLNVDQAGNLLYAISETAAEDGTKTSDAAAYTIDPATGKLTEASRAYALNGPACHIQRSANNKYLTLTSYHKGSISLVELAAGGKVGSVLDIQQHVGQGDYSGVAPHLHSSFYSPDQRFLLACDLGLDLIRTYRIDEAEGKLVPVSDARVEKGAGPRHLTFHPSGKFAYVINELNSTVTAFHYDAEHGTLETLEAVPTLPAEWTGANGCAEITISADGRFLYGSNRGHDSIVVYAVDPESGKLTTVQHVSTEGQHPRHFSIVPGGKHVIAANRDTNNLTLFTVDQKTGKLTYTGHSVEVSKPVCVWAVRF
uniref:lactonase family protein n=1 Tax=Paenibacillus terrae TaxID=159743 RepID=UPI0011A0D3D2|nr:lactonase family protein [Paenibacillus terrae]